MSRKLLMLATATVLVSGALAAHASPIVTATNSTVTVGNDGNYYTAGIGDQYQTTGLAVSVANAGGGMEALTFTYTTNFTGSESVGGYTVNLADVFIRTPSAGYSTNPFNYAISLGGQTANGDSNSFGLYSGGSAKTSNDIWGSRSGITYGAAYTSPAHSPTYSPYTVATGGTKLAGGQGPSISNGKISFTIDVSSQLAALFSQGFDIFWGTGDCANGSFLATIQGLDNVLVPEPASFALMGAGLVAFGFMRRRKSGSAALAA